ncbi:DEAD/DEAH box helicase family protein [Gordonia alkaliphila]|uniref:DEAD/DEAH box helicase family protein n=1 Tax=Gordonia alkaliphila TaxID=1053547 RepID=UPI001FF1334F|nr:DEAD/DEAH box helicase family protein [Gordonia alkaliphila]MCK0441235.1 DEAD/DEAH box helicase family protein [Gordonia alkaliphila]
MTEMTYPSLADLDLVAEISARLDLREPNRQALESVALATSQHFDVDHEPPPFECVVDSATGVGKTYVMAGLIEYFSQIETPVRNFLILAPGRTIRHKTIQNFTPGHRKSLTGSMVSRPYLVTADNFKSPATVAAMADTTKTKLFVFSVQALTSKSGEGRATHEFQETLGGSLYKWLKNLEDLVILADESHCYRSAGFARTITDLTPEVVIGMTATPLDSEKDLIVYRYPLADAIRDQYVKTPVLVARHDDRKDTTTKLLDGVTLLRCKADIARAYCEENGLPTVNPVMLVIADSTAAADEFCEILDSEAFDNGAWIGKTLVVHSNLSGDAKEDALAKLEAVEDPASPVRIIISVGMLKEGWDVKNVWVIASMRPSISSVLTEQTLGRGMRLPFGSYTGVRFLDSLEVLAHERYEAILRKRESLNEQFVDYAVWMSTRTDSEGNTVIEKEETPPVTPAIFPSSGEGESAPVNPEPAQDSGEGGCPGPAPEPVSVTSLEEVTAEAERQAREASEKKPRVFEVIADREKIVLPYVDQKPISPEVTLNQITNLAPFTELGRSIGVSASDDLKRTRLESVHGKLTGVTDTETVRAGRVDIPLETTREDLITAILNTPGVPRKTAELGAAQRIADAVIDGIGDDAAAYLSAYLDSAKQRTSGLVRETLLSAGTQGVTYDDEVLTAALDSPRTITKKEYVTADRATFDRALAYEGWKRSLYPAATFDSSPEYKTARVIDNADEVVVWARLHRNDLPITWTREGRTYNPDFVVIEEVEGVRRAWLVEVKSDKDAPTAEVQGKKNAAKVWANIVNSSGKTPNVQWGYLLLTETDIREAHESWQKMKSLAS